MTREPKQHDEAPSVISDHLYESRSSKWWDLCKHCGLAQAAHNGSTPEAYAAKEAHFATLKRVSPLEVMQREKERIKLGDGRVRIGYIGDEYEDDE